METGHEGVIANLRREDVRTVTDNAIGFLDDCTSECPEDVPTCCAPGSGTHVESAPRSRSSSTQAHYSAHRSEQSVYQWQTYIRTHVSVVESIASVSAKAKRTVTDATNLETAMTTIVLPSDSAMAETSIPAVINGASMTTEVVPDATGLMSSTTGSVKTTAAAEQDPPKESTDTQGMPPMSIALIVIAIIVIVAVSLLGLGCWTKRRRMPPSVNEMVEVEEEMDELHELGQQHTKSRTYRSISRNTSRTSRTYPSRPASRATNASRSTTSSTSSRPPQSISRTTTLVGSTAK